MKGEFWIKLGRWMTACMALCGRVAVNGVPYGGHGFTVCEKQNLQGSKHFSEGNLNALRYNCHTCCHATHCI